MDDFIILKENQVFGDERLEPIKKMGPGALITDFSLLLGGQTNGTLGNYWILGDKYDSDYAVAVVESRFFNKRLFIL